MATEAPLPMTPENGEPKYNWQGTMKTNKERFAFLFRNDILSDIHFLVGKGDSQLCIPAHKFVLTIGSVVFDAMFNGQLSNNQKEIKIPDVEPQAFLSLLRFIYNEEVDISNETVMMVLYTAKKYAVTVLEQACSDFLKDNISHDNAFMLLTQACLFDEPQLTAHCLEFIDKNPQDSLSAECFTDIDINTLCLVLKRDTLSISEAKLFQYVVKWSEAECVRCDLPVNSSNQRAVLGCGLSLVHFPLMTVEEFGHGPAQSGILTNEETLQLFMHLTVNPKPPVNFPNTPRCSNTWNEQTVCRFQQIDSSSSWRFYGNHDSIIFMVDRKIYVVGFGLYGYEANEDPHEYKLTIQINKTNTGSLCASNGTRFTSDGTANISRVMFKEAVEVFPNTKYTAFAKFLACDSNSYCGIDGAKNVVVECPSGDNTTFIFFTDSSVNNNGTSVDEGQIPEIIFYTKN